MLTINNVSKVVISNGFTIAGVSLAEIPVNVSVFSWNGRNGSVLYNDSTPQLRTSSLPDWAVGVVNNVLVLQPTQIALINDSAQRALNALVAKYPALEVSTWPQQVAEATALQANNQVKTPLLTTIAQQSNQTVATLASRVLELAHEYSIATGVIIGRRIALTADIMSATDATAISNIKW